MFTHVIINYAYLRTSQSYNILLTFLCRLLYLYLWNIRTNRNCRVYQGHLTKSKILLIMLNVKDKINGIQYTLFIKYNINNPSERQCIILVNRYTRLQTYSFLLGSNFLLLSLFLELSTNLKSMNTWDWQRDQVLIYIYISILKIFIISPFLMREMSV